jgi:hypothetical protein
LIDSGYPPSWRPRSVEPCRCRRRTAWRSCEGTRRSQRLADAILKLGIEGRPKCLPSTLARAMPAFTRSRISIARTRQTHPSFETLLCLPESSCRCPCWCRNRSMPRACSSAPHVLQTAAETINRPRHGNIEPAPRGVLLHGVEARTLIPTFRARARIPIQGHDLVSHSHSLELILMRIAR